MKQVLEMLTQCSKRQRFQLYVRSVFSSKLISELISTSRSNWSWDFKSILSL